MCSLLGDISFLLKWFVNRSKIQEKINSRTISHNSVPLRSTCNLLYILFFLFSTEQLGLTPLTLFHQSAHLSTDFRTIY